MWNEFKAFLRRSLGNSQAFVDAYWEKIKRDSQYQLEEVFDWTAYLKYLLVVFWEFDPAATPSEEIMIRYFREGLRPSVRAQLDTWGRDLDFWEEPVEKAVNAEAKAMLQSSFSTCEMDSRCPQEYKPVKKEEKDSGKNKSTDSTPADMSSGKQSSSIQQTSSANPKKDQNHQQGRRRCERQKQGRGRNSPATGANANANAAKKEEKNISQVKCFTYHQKRHYSNKYPQNPNRKRELKN